MSRAGLSVLIFVVIIAFFGGLAFWKYRGIKAAMAQPPMPEMPEAVDVVDVRSTPWKPMATLVGTIVAEQSIVVSNEVAGVVKEVGFGSGDVVDQGAVLLTMDDSVERADLADAEASVRVAEAGVRVVQANIKLWETNVRRLSAAVESKSIAETELDNARAQLDSANAERERALAGVDQAKAHVNQVRAALEKKTIRSPFRARAGLRYVHPGQFLGVGAQVVGLQGVGEFIHLDFAIPQEYASRVHVGEKVLATSSALGTEAVEVSVVAMDASADRETRNIRVRAKVPNKNDQLRPGMFLDVTVPVGDESTFATVPVNAVRRAASGDHVWLVRASEKPEDKPGTLRATQRIVKLGPTLGAEVIVLEGLMVGDKVAAGGSFKLRDGAMVMPGGAGGGHGEGQGK